MLLILTRYRSISTNAVLLQRATSAGRIRICEEMWRSCLSIVVCSCQSCTVDVLNVELFFPIKQQVFLQKIFILKSVSQATLISTQYATFVSERHLPMSATCTNFPKDWKISECEKAPALQDVAHCSKPLGQNIFKCCYMS